MKSNYSKLFKEVDEHITNQASSVKDWENLRVMFDFLSSHLTMMINKEKRKPSKFKNQVAQSAPPVPRPEPIEEEYKHIEDLPDANSD